MSKLASYSTYAAMLGLLASACTIGSAPGEIQDAFFKLEEQHMVFMINQNKEAVPTCKIKQDNKAAASWYATCYNNQDNSHKSYWLITEKNSETKVFALNGDAITALDSFTDKSNFITGAGNVDIKHMQIAKHLFIE